MRGGDGAGLRAYNERLIIGAIRQAGALSKAEIARATGLSAQAASVIVNRLLAERVLEKRPKLRGQIGQPQTPIALNPAGAFSVGVKIGRSSVEAVLVDFTASVVAHRVSSHRAPLAGPTLETAAALVNAVAAQAPAARMAGLGVAMPGHIHLWAEEMGLARGALDDWREADPAAALAAATGLDATLCNDATAACAAELALGEAIGRRSALYLYLGAFVGGGLVLDGRLYGGAQDNAGALGSMPMAERGRQLIHAASPLFLMRALEAAGLDPESAAAPAPPAAADAAFSRWRDAAADALARAIASAASVVDVEIVVIDGWLSPPWLSQVVEATQAALDAMNLSGLSPFALSRGGIGARARVLGAAILPLQAKFAPDPDLVLRGAARQPETAQPELATPR